MNKEYIEQEYRKLVEWHESTKRSQKETGIGTVLRFLYDMRDQKTWWWSWEFIGKHNSQGGYLSHRAPARASDLAIHYSHLVEDRKIGRFAVYRIRLENHGDILRALNGDYTPPITSTETMPLL